MLWFTVDPPSTFCPGPPTCSFTTPIHIARLATKYNTSQISCCLQLKLRGARRHSLRHGLLRQSEQELPPSIVVPAVSCTSRTSTTVRLHSSAETLLDSAASLPGSIPLHYALPSHAPPAAQQCSPSPSSPRKTYISSRLPTTIQTHLTSHPSPTSSGSARQTHIAPSHNINPGPNCQPTIQTAAPMPPTHPAIAVSSPLAPHPTPSPPCKPKSAPCAPAKTTSLPSARPGSGLPAALRQCSA